ncbi:MAG: hypothetical protein JKX78_06765 [Alteromonadaceae bacterium]|nr:hypothetical protein [Alteromonadaceae bacterium]
MLNKLILTNLLFFTFVNFANATEAVQEQIPTVEQTQQTLNSSHDSQANNIQTLNDDQILQSIDDISTLLESEINHLDQQQVIKQEHSLLNNKPSQSMLKNTDNIEDLDSIDSLNDFDDLALDEILNIDTFEQEQNNEFIAPLNKGELLNNKMTHDPQQELIDNTINNTIDKLPKSVGVQGNEEKTINNLDNSDLMDYLKGEDIWQKDLSDDNGIEFDY